jgi:phosphoglycolate phosphatase
MIKLILFDLDGTLVDTRQDIANSVNHVLAEFDLPPRPLDEVTAAVGGGIEKLMERVILSKHPGLKVVKGKLLKKFRQHYRTHCADFSRPYPGITECLTHFAGRTMSVFSNKPEAFCQLILESLKMEASFHRIIGGDTTPVKKPRPDGLKWILDQYGLLPEACLMVGDSAPDILVAKQLGVPTIAIKAGMGNTQEMLAAGPDYVIERHAELKPLLYELFKSMT